MDINKLFDMKYFLFIPFSLLIKVVIAQGNDITLTLFKDSENARIVLNEEGNFFEIFSRSTKYFEDFYYLGSFQDERSDFVLFEEYSNPAGVKRLYIYNTKNDVLYKTIAFNEVKIPLIQTIDLQSKVLQYLSIDANSCGQFKDSELIELDNTKQKITLEVLKNANKEIELKIKMETSF
jgi:hypothetical protein